MKIKNQNAVSLGRLGGLKGGKARAAKLSRARLTEIASKAAQTRWQKSKGNPMQTEELVKSQSKIEVATKILEEVGAISATPPSEWKEKVVEELAKQNINMHQTYLYQIRRKLLEKNGLKGQVRKKRQYNRKVENVVPIANTLNQVKQIKAFAEQFGGLKRLAELCQVLAV